MNKHGWFLSNPQINESDTIFITRYCINILALSYSLKIKLFIFVSLMIRQVSQGRIGLLLCRRITCLCSKLRKNITMTYAWITAPTSDGSHLNELPLNSGTSMVNPFFIIDHLYRQGIVAISELLVYVVRVNVVLESIN